MIARPVRAGSKFHAKVMMMAYIFDFFGVISSEVAPVWFQKRLPGYTVDQLRALVLDDADLGHISFDELCEKLGVLAQVPESAVKDEWYELAVINAEVVTVLARLKQSHQIALLSDAPADFLRTILHTHNLESLFDTIVISSEVGLKKPMPEIFTLTLAGLSASAGDTLFIDDKSHNTEAAATLGMETILFEQTNQITGLVTK